MAKEYSFVFYGTKEEFLNKLSRFKADVSYSRGTFFYLDDYIVERIDDEIHFGIARGGHSGGYWFIPTITYLDDRIEFRGKIQYIGAKDKKRSAFKKMFDGIEEVLLFVFLLPIVLIVRGYLLVEWLVRKICNRPKPKEKTNKERLFDLMKNYFNCVAE